MEGIESNFFPRWFLVDDIFRFSDTPRIQKSFPNPVSGGIRVGELSGGLQLDEAVEVAAHGVRLRLHRLVGGGHAAVEQGGTGDGSEGEHGAGRVGSPV